MIVKRLYRKNPEPILERDYPNREHDFYGDDITHRKDYDMRTDDVIEEEYEFEVS